MPVEEVCCCCSGSDLKHCTPRPSIWYFFRSLWVLWIFCFLLHSGSWNLSPASGRLKYMFGWCFFESILLISSLVPALILDSSRSRPWVAQPTTERTRRGGAKAIGKILPSIPTENPCLRTGLQTKFGCDMIDIPGEPSKKRSVDTTRADQYQWGDISSIYPSSLSFYS